MRAIRPGLFGVAILASFPGFTFYQVRSRFLSVRIPGIFFKIFGLMILMDADQGN